MQTHERGASRVPLLAFLSVLVLMIGSAFLAYMMWNEKKTAVNSQLAAIEARNAAAADDEIVGHYIEDVAKAVGERGAYKGRSGWKYEVDGKPVTSTDPEIAAIQLDGATLPSKVKEVMADFATNAGISPRDSLAELFGAAVDRVNSLQQQIDTLKSAEAGLNAQIQQRQTQLDDATRDAVQAQSDLSAELRRKDQEFQSSIEDKNATINAANGEFRRISEQLADQTAENLQVVAGLRREIETLQARIDAAASKTRLINPKQQPDGMVLEASQAAGMAWINLGRRDMLPVGTAFEITSASTGKVKGTGVVTQVDQARALLRITSLADKFDPIQQYDQVRNDLFSPNMTHSIYLMGSFRAPYNKPMLRTLLENLGNRVSDRLSPSVDLVLVGDDPINEDGTGFTPIEETDDYQRAAFLRLEMAPLSRMRGFLKLSDEDTAR